MRHQNEPLDVMLEVELVFEKGGELVGLELEFVYGPEVTGLELEFGYSPEVVESELDCRQAMLKPSKNLPAIESAGIILPYAAMVSMAHLSCTCDHQFAVDAMQVVVQRSVTFSVDQR